MRILAKNSIINKLSLSPTVSRFDNTFFIVCIDEKSKIKFFKNIILLRHSSFLRYFNFSDSYVCFLNIIGFNKQLKLCLEHMKTGDEDGTNMLLGYVFKGFFINVYNVNLLDYVVNKYNKLYDFEGYFLQIVYSFLTLLENFIIYIVDSFVLDIDDYFFKL